MADALPALTGQRVPRAEPPAPPPGFEWLAGLPPDEALARLALMLPADRRPPVVASLAVASGVPGRVAFATAEAMHLEALQLVAEVVRECGLRPWAAGNDPKVIAREGFEGIN